MIVVRKGTARPLRKKKQQFKNLLILERPSLLQGVIWVWLKLKNCQPLLDLAYVAGGSGCARETFCGEAANSLSGYAREGIFGSGEAASEIPDRWCTWSVKVRYWTNFTYPQLWREICRFCNSLPRHLRCKWPRVFPRGTCSRSVHHIWSHSEPRQNYQLQQLETSLLWYSFSPCLRRLLCRLDK